MIRIERGTEPPALAAVRRTKIPELGRLAVSPSGISVDITGYQLAAEPLWTAQHKKCCYCERKIEISYHDVEHYRPKKEADRQPGCAETHGYWWLAFTWKNLLFACPACNRSGKNTQFPLDHGSTPLFPRQKPPGLEVPLLLDPAAENPVTEIRFAYTDDPAPHLRGVRHWIARPRNGSPRGANTIEVLGLNRQGVVGLRDDHVERTVRRQADALKLALVTRDRVRITDEHARCSALFEPGSVFAALSYDALRHLVPAALLRPWKLRWPEPHQIALPPPPPPRSRGATGARTGLVAPRR